MNPRYIAYCATALLIFVDGTASGKDYPSVIGAGGNSCGTWTAEQKMPRRLEDEAWLVGYISAANRFAPGAEGDLTNGIEGRGLISWMDNYCQSHPLNMIETGAVALVDELRKRRAAR